MTPQEIAELRAKYYNATLVAVRKANPDLWIFRVQPDFPIPSHRAGQYSTLGLGNWEARTPGCQEEDPKTPEKPILIRRAYSISSSIIDERGELLEHPQSFFEFYIVLVRESGRGGEAPALTPRLFHLEEGARLFMGEKVTGHFTTQAVQPDDTVIFLATGTGEAPHNYMTWELLKNGHKGKILSVCCVRYLRDLGYLDIHENLMDKFPNYSYHGLTTREPSQQGKKMYIQDFIKWGLLEEKLGAPLDPEHTQVFLCGNPKMIGVPEVDKKTGEKSYPSSEGVIEILEKRGFQMEQPRAKIKGNIHFEEYW